MTESAHKPIVFLAFANDRNGAVGQLLNLPDEERRGREKSEGAPGLCELVLRPNCTAVDILKVLQDARYRDRIAIFHFSGHANNLQLLLETRNCEVAADATGLASFLVDQHGLQLVCPSSSSPQEQVNSLFNANKRFEALNATLWPVNDESSTTFLGSSMSGRRQCRT